MGRSLNYLLSNRPADLDHQNAGFGACTKIHEQPTTGATDPSQSPQHLRWPKAGFTRVRRSCPSTRTAFGRSPGLDGAPARASRLSPKMDALRPLSAAPPPSPWQWIGSSRNRSRNLPAANRPRLDICFGTYSTTRPTQKPGTVKTLTVSVHHREDSNREQEARRRSFPFHVAPIGSDHATASHWKAGRPK